MKRLALFVLPLLVLAGCDKKAFDKEEEKVQVVPVVLRDKGENLANAGSESQKRLAAAATVVTVTVFKTESPKEGEIIQGEQIISLPRHVLKSRCGTNDLALVGGVAVPADEFHQLFSQPSLDSMPNYLRRTYDKERGAFIDQLIQNKVLEYAAAHEDFSKEKGYAEAVEDAVHKVNMEYFFERYINKDVAVSDEEVEAYYKANQAEFTKPSQYRAAHILIQVSPQAYRAEVSNAYQKAEGLRRRILEGEDFGQLAAAYSDCPSKVKGGDLDFFTKGQTHPAFEKAVERLQKGDVSGIVETSQGYHIIKLLDRIPERVRSLEETKDEIKANLEIKKAQETYGRVMNSLTNKYKVIRNEKLIRSLVEKY